MPRGSLVALRKKRATDEPETERTAKFRKAVDDGADEFLCPITQALPVDPVMAEDGRVYERSAIATWLAEKQTSPHTNQEMGTKLIPALQVKNMIDRMVRTGAWTGEKIEAWRLKIKEEKEVEATRNVAEAGDVQAMIQLADWYANGTKGVTEDPALRFAWAKRAADLDDPDGLYEVSRCYQYGYGTEVNEELYLIKLVQAAMLGHMESMRGLMIHHYCKDEFAEALYWSKRGAKEKRMIGRNAKQTTNPAVMIPTFEKLIEQAELRS